MRVPLILYAVALAARVASGLLYPHPAYPDAFYYVDVARSLSAGHGFTVDFIWNFVDVGGRLPADPVLPIPSNAHWMPLASLVQLPFLALFGTTALASWLPFALLAAVAAPVTWAIARDAGLGSTAAAAAGLMAAMPGAVAPFLTQPDNFALFMPLGALSLWLCTRGLAGDRPAFALGGLAVGLATLSRNDGILLAVPFVLGFLRDAWRGRSRGVGVRRVPVSAALAAALLFVVTMAPWYLRQLVVLGSLSPSAQSGRILWITEYRQLFSTTSDTSLAAFLAQGAQSLVQSRLEGLGAALLIFAAMPLLLFLVPFLLWGAWARRRSAAFGPWFVYAAVLFALSGLLFAVHVPYGTFLHSAVALVPHAYVLAVDGIALAVAWVARRRPRWDVPRASRNFALIAASVLWLVGAVATWQLHGQWGTEAAWRGQAAAFLARAAGPDDRLMSPNPGAYRYDTGLGGVVTPEDPLAVVEQVARAYGVRWLVLERDHMVASLGAVYRGSVSRPAWISPPLVTVPAPGGTGDAEASPGDLPLMTLYAVCFDPASDPRAACRSAVTP